MDKSPEAAWTNRGILQRKHLRLREGQSPSQTHTGLICIRKQSKSQIVYSWICCFVNGVLNIQIVQVISFLNAYKTHSTNITVAIEQLLFNILSTPVFEQTLRESLESCGYLILWASQYVMFAEHMS